MNKYVPVEIKAVHKTFQAHIFKARTYLTDVKLWIYDRSNKVLRRLTVLLKINVYVAFEQAQTMTFKCSKCSLKSMLSLRIKGEFDN